MESLVKAVAADLITAEPAEGQQAALAPFVPLIGSWSLAYAYRRGNGERVEGSGYAHFGWGLGGNAIVDIWRFEDGAAGTTIRFYDPRIDAFRSTWIWPSRHAVVPFVGRVVGGRIVLNARMNDPRGRRLRWQFVSIQSSSFSWTGEVSDDDGKAWIQNQEIEGTRT